MTSELFVIRRRGQPRDARATLNATSLPFSSSSPPHGHA
ncbi:hypothetical protein AKJ09_10729 [Labilithrix luteola]|uniref:Uncharacterized protein n=1 Tax=Labilithrix luteola TaxID=1391654 RepID=A0A0K1QE67_9BACT|nr:hypothetical protein AKJ09_10729 [Labilithrix luteola]